MRDLVGYGPTAPLDRWPDGSLVAVAWGTEEPEVSPVHRRQVVDRWDAEVPVSPSPRPL